MDRVGDFTVSGGHEPSGAVRFAKAYASHGVAYTGTWDGAMIAGRWRLQGRSAGLFAFGKGEFEIWPEGDDEAIERMEAALALTA